MRHLRRLAVGWVVLWIVGLWAPDGAFPREAVDQSPETAADFSVLVGTWVYRAPGDRKYVENWRAGACGDWEGDAAMMAPDGKIVLKEILRIQRIGNDWVYIAAVNGQQPVLFTWTDKFFTAPGNRKPLAQWTFENGEHDYPQRIVYFLLSANELLACVEGKRGSKIEQEEFLLIREQVQ